MTIPSRTTDWTKIPIPDSYVALHAYYGDPTSEKFASQFLVTEKHMVAGILRPVVCHAAIAGRLHNIWEELTEKGLLGLIGEYNGCYVLRDVRGSSTRLSLHAWGLAIDVNASEFPLGSTKQQDQRLIDTFRSQGFFWGGDFHHRKDPMHFQFTKPNTI